MYIGEAKNLTEHTPLSATGYIYNPHNPGVGPRLYPPVFPVLLVPAYVIGGLNNLTPMKVEIVLFFIALLIVLWRGLGRGLSLPYRAGMLGILGFNRSEEHTSELQSRFDLVCRLLLEKKKT